MEKVDVRVRPPLEVDRLAAGDDPVGLLIRELKTLAEDKEKLTALSDELLKELKQKLPDDLSRDQDLGIEGPDVLADVLREAEGELLARLASERGGQ